MFVERCGGVLAEALKKVVWSGLVALLLLLAGLVVGVCLVEGLEPFRRVLDVFFHR